MADRKERRLHADWGCGVKVLRNTGQERVVDALRPLLPTSTTLDVATARLSLFAFQALAEEFNAIERARLIVSSDLDASSVLGETADRPLITTTCPTAPPHHSG